MTVGLQALLQGLAVFSDQDDRQIAGLALDSRLVKAGDAFIALAGSKQHGLVHVEQAIANGAVVVIFDPAQNGLQLADLILSAPTVAIEDLAVKLGELASRFYGDPSQFIDVIGITGTNGKTSCSQFLSQVLDDCGIIGTLGWGEWGRLNATVNTTPDALAVQKILDELVKDNKHTVAMEVSSHGLAQGRVNGVRFKAAVFTNISRDHLDYHGTMAAYIQAKLSLLKKPGLDFAIVNLDDASSEQIIAAVPETVKLWGFSAKGKAVERGEIIYARNIVHKIDGIECELSWGNLPPQPMKSSLYGDFTIENLLAVLTVMLALGISLEEAVKRLAKIKPVIGRMERFGGGEQPLVFVDYAHTPDALDKVLSSLRKHTQQDLWLVFGCGGNRDKGKRAEMGKIARFWADHLVITDDNPRDENSLAIIDDILAACNSTKVDVIQNREQAIQKVIMSAAKNDCIVIAGKGHEQYQECNGERLPFCDQQVVTAALDLRKVTCK